MSHQLKKRVYRILKNVTPEDHTSRAVEYFLNTLVILNVIVVILETDIGLEAQFGTLFVFIDTLIVLILSIEYILRVWSCTALKRYSHPVYGRIKYMASPLAIIDLLAILPFYAPFLLPPQFRFFKLIRLFRLIRILKIYRYSDALQAFVHVLNIKKRQLFASLLTLLILVIFSSSVLHIVEYEAQPEHFGSIPAAMWWAIITLSTVGYGDVVPITPLGRFFGAIVAILAFALFAIPAGILASGYTKVSFELARQRNNQIRKRRR